MLVCSAICGHQPTMHSAFFRASPAASLVHGRSAFRPLRSSAAPPLRTFSAVLSHIGARPLQSSTAPALDRSGRQQPLQALAAPVLGPSGLVLGCVGLLPFRSSPQLRRTSTALVVDGSHMPLCMLLLLCMLLCMLLYAQLRSSALPVLRLSGPRPLWRSTLVCARSLGARWCSATPVLGRVGSWPLQSSASRSLRRFSRPVITCARPLRPSTASVLGCSPQPFLCSGTPVLGRVGSWPLQSSAVHAVLDAVVHAACCCPCCCPC